MDTNIGIYSKNRFRSISAEYVEECMKLTEAPEVTDAPEQIITNEAPEVTDAPENEITMEADENIPQDYFSDVLEAEEFNNIMETSVQLLEHRGEVNEQMFEIDRQITESTDTETSVINQSKNDYFIENIIKHIDATKAAINYFRTVYSDGTFGLPSDMSSTASYSSDSFLSNQCVFTICSSGGLSYNIKEGYGRKFRVAPIPYNTADKKFVISQGTNLAVFDRGDAKAQKQAFEAIVALTTGDLQSEWAVQTGYYPASISATNGTAYQNLINNAPKNETEAAYQEAAKVNEAFI